MASKGSTKRADFLIGSLFAFVIYRTEHWPVLIRASENEDFEMKSLKIYLHFRHVSINPGTKWNILFCAGQRPREMVMAIENSSGFPFCWKDKVQVYHLLLFFFFFLLFFHFLPFSFRNLNTESDIQILLYQENRSFWWECLCHIRISSGPGNLFSTVLLMVTNSCLSLPSV